MNYDVTADGKCFLIDTPAGPRRGLLDAFTGTAITFPSAATKNNSSPSPRQRGCSPPATDIVVCPSAHGK